MLRISLSLLFILGAGLGQAGTFELTDPSEQFMEQGERSAPQEDEVTGQSAPAGLRCTVDLETGACFCFAKESGEMMEMRAGECEAAVRKALDRKGSS